MLPMFLWALIVAVTPTDWARERLARRLTQEIGQPVSLGGVRIGPLGGVTIEDLKVGANSGAEGPWLRAASTSINLNLPQLLMGQCLPSEVRVDGLTLNYHRQSDGECPIASALFAKRNRFGGHASVRSTSPRGTVRLEIQGGTIRFVDDPSATNVELTSIDGVVLWEAQRLVVQDFTGHLNGGTVSLVAQFDRSSHVTGVEGQIRARDVQVNGGWNGLGIIVPILASSGDALEGAMDLSVYARGLGGDAEELNTSLVGTGFIKLDPVRLDGSKLLNELVPPQGIDHRVGAIHSDFKIAGRRVLSENLTIEFGSIPIMLAGSTTFEGLVDYRIKPEGLTNQVRGHLGDLADLVEDLVDLRITGTLGDLNLTSAGKRISRQDGRERLKELSKVLKERLLR